jgi:hypothetical protein
MLNILLLFTVYTLNNSAVAEPLHGYLNDDGTPITYATIPPSYDLKLQQTTLQGSVTDDNSRHGTHYWITPRGLVLMALNSHHDSMFKRGDRILTIDGRRYTRSLMDNIAPDVNCQIVVKRKSGITEEITWFKMTPWEYEQNR